jgi:hypothetical protein
MRFLLLLSFFFVFLYFFLTVFFIFSFAAFFMPVHLFIPQKMFLILIIFDQFHPLSVPIFLHSVPPTALHSPIIKLCAERLEPRQTASYFSGRSPIRHSGGVHELSAILI